MFKKRSRNFRSRKEADEESEDEVVVAPLTAKSKPSVSSANVSSTSKTLFNISDEEEEFRVKKSTTSYKFKRTARQKKYSSSDEDYRVDSRRPSPPKPKPPPAGHFGGRPIEEITVKPLVAKVQELDDTGVSSVPKLAPNYSDSPQIMDKLGRGVIPNAAEIHAARKRRQQARECGDYISLKTNDSREPSVPKSTGGYSSSGGEEERIEMVGKRNESHIQRITIKETIDDHSGDEDHSDDEATRWEKEQLAKVLGKGNMRNIVERTSALMRPDPPSKYAPADSGFDYNAVYQKPPSAVTEVSLPPLPDVSSGDITAMLRTKLAELKSVHQRTSSEIESVVQETHTLANAVKSSKQFLPQYELQYKFYQGMKLYCNDLIDCLNEKFAVIEKVEEIIHECFAKEAIHLIERRAQEVKDESFENNMRIANGETQDLDPNRQYRAQARYARRARRMQNRQQTNSFGLLEGMSSDEEIDQPLSSQVAEERSRATNEMVTLFEDTVDEFHRVDVIMSRFERWKGKYPETFDSAYISDCLPRLFSPFVRAELIYWDPLRSSASDLEVQSWFKLLCVFGVRSTEVIGETEHNDPLLVCKIIERTVLPKVSFFIRECWDPFSSKQSSSLKNVIYELFSCYPTVKPESKNSQIMVQGILDRLRTSASDECFVPIYTKQAISTHPFLRSFLERQFWQCFKLLRTVALFCDIISPATLREIFVESILNRYLLIALQSHPQDASLLHKLRSIVSCVPKEWLDDHKIVTLDQLSTFVRYLGQVVCASYECNSLENAREVLTLLLKLGAVDHARSIILTNQMTSLQPVLFSDNS